MCRERLFLAACADETSANRYIPRNRIETIIINDRSRWFSIGTARSIPRFKLTTPARLPMEISGTVTNDRFPFIYLMSIKLVHDRPIAVHEAHKYVTNSANNINFTRKIDILVSTDNKIPSFFNSYIYIYILAVSVFFVNSIPFGKKNILAAAFRGTEHVSTSSLPHLFQYFFNSSQHTRHTRFLVLAATKLASF